MSNILDNDDENEEFQNQTSDTKAKLLTEYAKEKRLF